VWKRRGGGWEIFTPREDAVEDQWCWCMERERETYWRFEGKLLNASLDPVTEVDRGDCRFGAIGFDLFINGNHLFF
jgi:hypothetical protein